MINREITAIEGSWQIGKSTLLKTMQGAGYQALGEPLHTPEIKAHCDLDIWYAAMHLRNLEIAGQNDIPVVVERTVASDLAFMRTLNRGEKEVEEKIANIIKNSQRSGRLETVNTLIFLRTDPETYMKKRVPQINDATIVGTLRENFDQFMEYQQTLEYFVSILFPQARMVDVTTYDTDGFRDRSDIINSVNQQVVGVT
jgi:hypothetical protein